jgi:hypothetical protein
MPEGAGRFVSIGRDACVSIAWYLQYERGLDATAGESALFVTAASDTDRASGRLSAKSVDAIIGGEHNLRNVTTAPGGEIPEDSLDEIRQIVRVWTARNSTSKVRSARVVATTYSMAVPALHGSNTVRGAPARAVYLIVLEGDFVLQEARDSGASRAPTGSWIALVVHQSPPLRVRGVVLRPGPPESFSLRDLGLVHLVEL